MLQILEDTAHSLSECFIKQGDSLRRMIESYDKVHFLFRRIRHMATLKPHKRKKNTQYSKPYKRNYPYWKGYPYDKDGFNVVKMVDVKCDFASGNDYTAMRNNGNIQIVENK